MILSEMQNIPVSNVSKIYHVYIEHKHLRKVLQIIQRQSAAGINTCRASYANHVLKMLLSFLGIEQKPL